MAGGKVNGFFKKRACTRNTIHVLDYIANIKAELGMMENMLRKSLKKGKKKTRKDDKR